MAKRILTPTERVRARLYTGSLAHLVAGLMDWASLARRYAVARLRGRPMT